MALILQKGTCVVKPVFHISRRGAFLAGLVMHDIDFVAQNHDDGLGPDHTSVHAARARFHEAREVALHPVSLHFSSTPMRTTLSPGEVHVWQSSLDLPLGDMSYLTRLLTSDERGRADRFRLHLDRRRFIAGRGLLRLILARYLGTAPRALEFLHGAHGKPHLLPDPDQPPIRFNLSHVEGMALYALAWGREVGVDVEAVRPIPEAAHLVDRFFSPGERAQLRSLPSNDRLAAFFRCWTRKEACLKAQGMGLASPLDQVDVLHPFADAAESACGDEIRTGNESWRLCDIPIDAPYVAALAVQGSGWRLTSYRIAGIEELIGDSA